MNKNKAILGVHSNLKVRGMRPFATVAIIELCKPKIGMPTR